LLLKIYSLLTEDEKEKEIINEFINTYLQLIKDTIKAQRFIIKVLESLTLKRIFGAKNWTKRVRKVTKNKNNNEKNQKILNIKV